MTESKEVIIMSKRSASYSDDDDEPQHFMPAPSSVPDTVFDRIRLMEEMYRQENTRRADDYYDRPVSPRTHRRNIISAAERESKRLASDARLWQASMGDPTRQLALYLDNYDDRKRVGYDALKILALLESGADPMGYRGLMRGTILHSISEWSSPTGSNLVEILDKIVSRCRDLINIANKYEMLPIFNVCMSSSGYPDNTHRIAILKILIKYGAKIDVLNNRGMSPLGIAIFGAERIMFDFWLANGADPNCCGYGNRPIEAAVIRRNAYMVSRLLDLKVDLNFITEMEGKPMLQVGINHPDRDIQMCFVNWRFNAARGVAGVHDDFRSLGLKSGRGGGCASLSLKSGRGGGI
jgi:hypothetical protein